MTRTNAVSDTRGAVFVEFLIAFLPVYIFFLCLIQLSLLFAVKLVAEHAAINAARAAAVVIGDDPGRYGGERLHEVNEGHGARLTAVKDAALLTLAPFILNGTVLGVDVSFPPEDKPGGDGRHGPVHFAPMGAHEIQKVRVQLEVDTACRIGFANRVACPLIGMLTHPRPHVRFDMPTILVRAEAVYPYQGARYAYP